MTSWNGNIFAPLSFSGNSPTTNEFPSQKPVTWSSIFWAWTYGWVNNRDGGNLRRRRAHHYVTLMCRPNWELIPSMQMYDISNMICSTAVSLFHQSTAIRNRAKHRKSCILWYWIIECSTMDLINSVALNESSFWLVYVKRIRTSTKRKLFP